MSSTHSFVNDVFISYRTGDNKLLDDKGRGWIDNFHELFGYLLFEKLGYEPKIWRDARLTGNTDFSEELKERVGQTAVLISILSPGYMQSEWCLSELHEFCRAAEQTGGLSVDNNNSRIFKVVKTHLEREQHPPEFKKQTGYVFYEKDEIANKYVEFEQRGKQYMGKLDDLAVGVEKVLLTINSRRKAPPTGSVWARSQPSLGTIYLAQTTRDLSEKRDEIKRELEGRGYDILPANKEFPSFSPDYEEAVRKCVEQAKLSVHLIGGVYGSVPEGAKGRSIVRLQNEIAAERSGKEAFSRLLWMPEGLTALEDEQAQFIEKLRTDAAMQQGAELLITPLEELKSHIQKRLTANGKKPDPPSGQSSLKIYLICDLRDVKSVRPLSKYLANEKKYEVLWPLLEEGDEDDAMKKHNSNLAECDAVLIYYGTGKQAWFESKLRDLQKIVALEGKRESPRAMEVIYVAAPETPHKLVFSDPNAIMIEQFGDFAPADLADFIARAQTVVKGSDDATN